MRQARIAVYGASIVMHYDHEGEEPAPHSRRDTKAPQRERSDSHPKQTAYEPVPFLDFLFARMQEALCYAA